MSGYIWAQWTGTGGLVGGAQGHALLANVGMERSGRAWWHLSRLEDGHRLRVIARGHWVAAGSTPLDVVQDGADRALAAAWRRGLS